jgi:hypothetical protein
MSSIKITNIPPWDGTYDMQTDIVYNGFEWEWITVSTGYMPLTIQDGFAGGDPRLMVALAAISMQRAGRIREEQVLDVIKELKRAPFDGMTIEVVGDEVEDEPVPLDLTLPPAELSRTG